MKTCIRPNHQAHAGPRRALASRRSKEVLWLESVPVGLFERNLGKTDQNGLRYHGSWSAGGNSASQMGARTRWTKRQAVIALRACTVLTGVVSYHAGDSTSGEVRNPGNLQQQNQENQASERPEERSTPQAPTQWLGRTARLSLVPSHRGVYPNVRSSFWSERGHVKQPKIGFHRRRLSRSVRREHHLVGVKLTRHQVDETMLGAAMMEPLAPGHFTFRLQAIEANVR